MKQTYLLLLFLGSMLLFSCSDGKRSVNNQNEKEDHSAHQDKEIDKTEMVGMEGMNMEETNPMDTSLLSVVAAANKVVLSDQVSIAARLLDTVVGIKGYGYVSWDIRRNKKIAARTGGRVEKLFVKYNYQYVSKGQKILDLYTPEINSYAAEYLHHLTAPGDEVLKLKAKEKLKLLGVAEQQIRQLESSGYISNTLSVYSIAGGFVLFDADNNTSTGMGGSKANVGSEMGGGMSAGSANSQASYSGANAEGRLREGMYINRGQTIFYVNDFASAWGVLSFDEATQPLLKSGMNVMIKSELLDVPIRSKISFIEPAFNNSSQKFMQVRIYMANANRRLRINSLIEGTVDIPLNQKIIIPANAVFSLGKRKIVWVKTGITPNSKNIFKARDIQVGLVDKKIAVVTAGLAAAEEVAADAGYLLDSQSLIEQ